MSPELVRTIATYLIAVLVLIGSFVIIYQGRGDVGTAQIALGAVLGYVFRDAGGAAAVRNAKVLNGDQSTP